jgi:hypothetical protein
LKHEFDGDGLRRLIVTVGDDGMDIGLTVARKRAAPITLRLQVMGRRKVGGGARSKRAMANTWSNRSGAMRCRG